ncbi:lactate utilization protein C [Paenalkalicoccus suaedae]|uniref:Lactate utilization protein C n=1 Tax=Paenalkalicoccus suaedae TaxID=2592382 RepID=A0A859F9D6_9BACI|nr:lactate utilization protein C [Paenalkalicoccus suaedae]QKS69723.1 lactate utilization protein C [Paenalkalicoccus suaedae]
MIENRDRFLKRIASRLGREEPRLTGVKRPVYSRSPQHRVLEGASTEELVDVFTKQCARIHTDVKVATVDTLEVVLQGALDEIGAKSVLAWDDARFSQYGLEGFVGKVDVWREGEASLVDTAERADVGITFSDRTLAESGTVVLFSGPGRGRSVSLLPESYIAIVPKSTLVPRMTQVTTEIHERVARGDDMPSCINFISGPSNSADIEMSLVVGVHGPVRACYILVDDV